MSNYSIFTIAEPMYFMFRNVKLIKIKNISNVANFKGTR